MPTPSKIKFFYDPRGQVIRTNCELARDGATIEKEEYYPFGETSFASYGKKRYKYCGKERDTESGLYYYGARYYSAWTCRFFGVDPLISKYPYLTCYQYASNDPISDIDIDGMESRKEAKKVSEETPSNNNNSNNIPKNNIGFAIEIFIFQSKNSDGNLIESSNTVYNYAEGVDEGVLIKISNTDTGIYSEKYIPPINVENKLSFSEFLSKTGNQVGKQIEKTLGPTIKMVDNYFDSSSQVGMNIELKIDFNAISIGGKLGTYSTNEYNGGFEGAAYLTIAPNAKGNPQENNKTKLTTNLKDRSLKFSIKFNLYASHGNPNLNKLSVGFQNKTYGEAKYGFGRVSISSDTKGIDQFSLELGSKFAPEGIEVGIKNQSKVFFNTKLYNWGH